MQNFFLFLDFDGVLHPEVHGATPFENAPHLIQALKDWPGEAHIVLSTSWRENDSLEALKAALPPELGQRTHAMTPILPNGLHEGGRHREVLQWLEQNAQGDALWVAIDDWAPGFPEHCAQLLLIDKNTGFTSQDSGRLHEKLERLASLQHGSKNTPRA